MMKIVNDTKILHWKFILIVKVHCLDNVNICFILQLNFYKKGDFMPESKFFDLTNIRYVKRIVVRAE